MDKEIQLLNEAVSELKKLRSQNQVMSARLQMFDDLMLTFRTRPDYPQSGMGEDLVWKIEKHVQSTQDKSLIG